MEKCQQCGNMSVNDNNDCVVCDESASVNPYAVSTAITDSFPIDDISSSPEAEEYSKIFVGNRYYSFFPYGRDIPKRWNWAAFFIGVFWFIYRKMYLYAAIYLGLGLLLTGIQSMLGVSEIIANVISIGMGVGAGIWANRLYKQHMDKKIAETLAVAQKSEIIPALKASGGTNLVGALVALGILCAIIAMLM
ncbi:DUF2628 domain-containing protein [Limnobaculum parvum]|uniref:DUF2628 domain-containing protein n=1 Tax=Limnobaculum parvum TaxID=2172103 RepID=A0A2Y9U152_9GAMM|nr:DUF2628 domain-containing protein [Limnobaculum parvum]AWH89324.1 DUF2628 domain-containing protein [Limnobaculum parvum]